MSIRFGVSPIAWSNDDMPALGGDTPLDEILGDASELGFEGIELGGRFPRQADALKALLAPHALDLVGGWYGGALLAQDAGTEIAAMQAHLSLLQAMGSDVFVFAEVHRSVHGNRTIPLERRMHLPPDAWARFGERLTQVADHVAGQGMRFAYHHHMGTVVEDAEDLHAFLQCTGPSVGLTLDTGHAALGGIDAPELVAAHPGRIAHVHCKDVRGAVFERMQGHHDSFLDGVLAGVFTVPGDGDLDFDALMRALAAIDYSGWVVVEAEQDPAQADPRTFAAKGLATLRDAAGKAGLQ
jgi:inosose dehydratase